MANTRGFTIVELIVVIIVVAVLAVTAIPRFFNRGDYDLRGFQDKLVTTLQFARKTAVASRHPVCLTVNSAVVPHSLTLRISTVDPDTVAGADCSGGNGTTLPLPARDGNCAADVNNAICAPAGLSFSPATTFPNGAIIIFDPSGRPRASGTMTITGSAGTSTVTLEPETGYAHY